MGFKKTACESCGESLRIIRIEKHDNSYQVIYAHHVYDAHEPVPIQVDLATGETIRL